jgi:hypothetical protein
MRTARRWQTLREMSVSACPYARIIWIRFIGFSHVEISQALGHPEAMSVI